MAVNIVKVFIQVVFPLSVKASGYAEADSIVRENIEEDGIDDFFLPDNVESWVLSDTNPLKREYWYGCYGFTDDEEAIPEIYAHMQHEPVYCNPPQNHEIGDPELPDTFPGSGPYRTEAEAILATQLWLQDSGQKFAVVGRHVDGTWMVAAQHTHHYKITPDVTTVNFFSYPLAVSNAERANRKGGVWEYFVCPEWHVDDLLKGGAE